METQVAEDPALLDDVEPDACAAALIDVPGAIDPAAAGPARSTHRGPVRAADSPLPASRA